MSTHRDQSFCGIHIFVKYIASSLAMSTTLTACHENHPDRVRQPPDWRRVSVHLRFLDRVSITIVFGERAVEVPCIRIGGNWNSLDPRFGLLWSCVGIRGTCSMAARWCSSQFPKLRVRRKNDFWPTGIYCRAECSGHGSPRVPAGGGRSWLRVQGACP